MEKERGDQEQGGASYHWELYLSPGRGGKGEGGSRAGRGELSLGIVLVLWEGWKGSGGYQGQVRENYHWELYLSLGSGGKGEGGS